MHVPTVLIAGLGIAHTRAVALRQRDAPTQTTESAGSITIDVPVQTSAYLEGLQLSGTPQDNGNITADTIRLVNFDGCANMPGVANAEAQTYSGWQQAQKIMNVQAFKDRTVDSNSAGVLDYLGASGLNSPRQNDMKDIFHTFTTLTPTFWPFEYRMHVRCDDPLLWCSCGVGSDTMRAYTSNYDVESKLTRIDSCPEYFNTPTLNSVIDTAKNLPADQEYGMNRYWRTQGHVWTHVFMHIDWVASAHGPAGNYRHNQYVADMVIKFTDSNNIKRKTVAYKPEMAKSWRNGLQTREIIRYGMLIALPCS